MGLILTLVLCCLVVFLTYIFHNHTKLNAVQSSSLIGILLGIGIQISLVYKFDYLINYFIIGYGATFVGMTVKSQLKLYQQLLSSVVFGGICYFTIKDFSDLGGILGTIAFISVVFITGLFKLIKWKIGQ